MTNTPMQRTLIRTIDAQLTVEGTGFTVRRPFPTRALDHVDPFLLLDEAGPIVHEPGAAVGLSDHPHRGFETLTYVLEGEMESHDSTGFRDVMQKGDVEWTTAGRGIIHGGGPTGAGGAVKGIQLWVNLPRAKKMIAPKSQRITAASIPFIERPDSGYSIRVLGGNAEGVEGPVKPTWPILYLHYLIQPRGHAQLDVPSGQTATVYVLDGELTIGENDKLSNGQLGILSDGDAIRFSNTSDEATEFLVLAAEPIGEPVARYGPFVMNDREEVFQAFDDFKAGKFGS